jgi:hypothetical protein
MGSKRYGSASSRRATAWHWRDEIPVLLIEKGLALLIEDRRPFTLHLGFDGCQNGFGELPEERRASLHGGVTREFLDQAR